MLGGNLMYKGKKFIVAAIIGVMIVATGGVYVYGEDIVFAAKMSKAESDCKAKVDHITYSLKKNYLGLKNVGQWQQYIKEARVLANKLNKSIRGKYIDQINKAEALVNAAARVNKVEQSMSINPHTIKNTVTWDQYIRLAKTDLSKVNKTIFSKQISQLNDRIIERETAIDFIKTGITSQQITIGEFVEPVKAELIKPKVMNKDTKIVVMVGDSGPTDRNGGLGINSPYRDIGEGLAKKGIASLRFDKRAFSYGDKFSMEYDYNFSINEDYKHDYDNVIYHVFNMKNIDISNIYVIGFGQGGNVIPYLNRYNSRAKGYIFMGTNQSPTEESVARKIRGLISTSTKLTQSEKNQMIKITNEELKCINNLTESSPNDFYLEQSTKYWVIDKWCRLNTSVKSINKPMMFLHGENDVIVPVGEINKFKEELLNKENVTFKTYKGLTSEFITGPKNFDSYNIKGRVSQSVIDDIANFINK